MTQSSHDYWEIVLQALTLTVTLVAACFAYFRFIANRTLQTRLGIVTTIRSVPYGKLYLTCFEVKLSNTGTVKLGARKILPPDKDKRWGEVVPYACSLQVKQLKQGLPEGKGLGWFDPDCGPLSLPTDNGDPKHEAQNLLSEYMVTDSKGKDVSCDFWMEPGESYKLSVARILAPGHYLGKITFLGQREGFPWCVLQTIHADIDDGEFWSATLVFTVP
jgi:hypothetical protein